MRTQGGWKVTTAICRIHISGNTKYKKSFLRKRCQNIATMVTNLDTKIHYSCFISGRSPDYHSCRVKQLAALTALWIWIRRGRPSHKFDLRYFPIWIRLLHHGKLLDNSIHAYIDAYSREGDIERTVGGRNQLHALGLFESLPFVFGQDPEDDVDLFQLFEPQQSFFSKQLRRASSPRIPPRIARHAQMPRFENSARCVNCTLHPRPELVDEYPVSQRVEVVSAEEGLGCLRGEQKFVAGQDFVPRFDASLEEAVDDSRARHGSHATSRAGPSP